MKRLFEKQREHSKDSLDRLNNQFNRIRNRTINYSIGNNNKTYPTKQKDLVHDLQNLRLGYVRNENDYLNTDEAKSSTSSTSVSSSPYHSSPSFEDNNYNDVFLYERLYQLEEEAKLVEKQLRVLKKNDGGNDDTVKKENSSFKYKKPQSSVMIIKKPLLLSGSRIDIQSKNDILYPIFEEFVHLCNKLQSGCIMDMVVERANPKQNRDYHLSIKVKVWVGKGLSDIQWKIVNDIDNSEYQIDLIDVEAIFCCSKREAYFMRKTTNKQSSSIFRIHLNNGADPLQFACANKRDCQDWVVGLGLFHNLYTTPKR